ncbi:alpha/beta hydrolase [Henriciella sp. AS95]|uniref:alpha/beta hydrolase n=1 Tax=Henriciella sp. AS95 TaxID=3135782 RepID=UPI00317A9706
MSAPSQTQTDDLEPEVRTFVEDIVSRSVELTAGQPVDPRRRREVAELVRASWADGGPAMASVRELKFPQSARTMRLYIPEGGAGEGTLLYIHGGGWMLFSLDTHDRLMREYADAAGCAVVGLDYSLAPENPFPKALDEIIECVIWLRESGQEYGLNTTKLLIGGDSAGGNLTLAAAKKLRDDERGLPDGLLINYGALDTKHRVSHQRYDGAPYMLETKEMDDFWQAYLPDGAEEDPYALVLIGDLGGLPPTHLCVAECDILLDENKELHRRLTAEGNDVTAVIYPGVTHSFLEAVSISPTARQAIDDSAQWMKRVLGQ